MQCSRFNCHFKTTIAPVLLAKCASIVYIFRVNWKVFFCSLDRFLLFLKDFFISSLYRSAWRRSYYWNSKKAVSSRRNCRSDVYCPNFQPGHKFVMVHQWWTGKISIFYKKVLTILEFQGRDYPFKKCHTIYCLPHFLQIHFICLGSFCQCTEMSNWWARLTKRARSSILERHKNFIYCARALLVWSST